MWNGESTMMCVCVHISTAPPSSPRCRSLWILLIQDYHSWQTKSHVPVTQKLFTQYQLQQSCESAIPVAMPYTVRSHAIYSRPVCYDVYSSHAIYSRPVHIQRNWTSTWFVKKQPIYNTRSPYLVVLWAPDNTLYV